jgi:hypothetical protein
MAHRHSLATAAAPGGAHGALLPSATNPTAPVQTEACAAVEASSVGGVATGAGIAGIARAAGAARHGLRLSFRGLSFAGLSKRLRPPAPI